MLIIVSAWPANCHMPHGWWDLPSLWCVSCHHSKVAYVGAWYSLLSVLTKLVF